MEENFVEFAFLRKSLICFSISLLTLISLSSLVFGQNSQQIQGTVFEEGTQVTLPGVTVKIKGTNKAVTTDADGKYSIQAETTDVLVFSFLGFQTQEVTVGNQTILNIFLKTAIASLNEVVVVGYGTVKKSSLTASVSKVENRILDQVPSGRLETALTGRLAGVNISQPRSAPGSPPLIRIRGLGSIDAGNEPLVVIDGFPGGGLGSISLNDVESIEVLKDASSAAIYGSRAAGGVIIVTTKKGKAGKPKINFNAYTGLAKAMLHDDWITGDEYYQYAVKYQNREYGWIGGDVSIPVFGDERRPPAYQVSVAVKNGINTVWQNEVIRMAPIQNYNLSVGGGSENVKYYISGTVKSEQGTVKNTNFKQYGVRANLDIKVNPILSIGLLVNPIYSVRRIAPTTIANLNKYPPFVAAQTLGGNYLKARDYWGAVVTGQANPLAILNGSFFTANTFNSLGELYANFDILKGLRLRTSLGSNFSYTTDERFQASYATNNGINNGVTGDSRNINLINENVLSYNKVFNEKHNFSGIIGASFQKNTSRDATIGAVPGSFNNDNIRTFNNAIIDPAQTNTTRSQWGLISYFSRLNYSYRDKYLLAASIRTDGSSRFGPANKWGYFPSASVGWRISQEEFWRNNKILNDLKLRASYGVVGNFNIGDFDYLGRIDRVYYSPGNTLTNGQTQVSLENNALSWEKTRSYDIGADLGLFGNRVNITFDYYNKKTTGLLYKVSVPALTGFTSALSNIGAISNKGYEVEISSKNLTGAFKWQTSFNLSHNKNKVVDLGGEQERIYTDTYGMSWILRLGEPMFSYYGYRAIGVLQNAAQVSSIPVLPGSRPGNPIFEDVNKDGSITPADKVIMGNFQPKFSLGMVNDFSWGNFDLSITMQASLGAKIYNFENQFYQGSLLGAMRRSLVEGQWYSEQEPGNGRTPASALSTLNFQASSDIYIENASFLTVRNLNLGYTLPQSLTEKLHVNNLRFYTSISNPFMITSKGFHGYNPEGYTAGEIAGINSMPGYNEGSEPINRVITLGVNIGF